MLGSWLKPQAVVVTVPSATKPTSTSCAPERNRFRWSITELVASYESSAKPCHCLVLSVPVAGEDQNRIAAVGMVNQVLACFRLLRCVGLRLRTAEVIFQHVTRRGPVDIRIALVIKRLQLCPAVEHVAHIL